MKKIIVIIVLITFGILFWFLYQKLAFLNILVKFDDLEPFEKQMNVYYKGFKIGKSTKIYPDKDYTNTFLKLKIHPNNINLPENITAKIQKKGTGGYINIIYPDSPSLKKIKNNDVIPGRLTKDITTILSEEGAEEILSNASGLISNANTAVQSLNGIFIEVHGILQDIRPDIKLAVSNLTKTTTNLKEMSSNMNSSLNKESLTNSVKNVENTTKSLSDITVQIDRTTIPVVNSVLCQTNSTMRNVNEITGGVKNTLKKHFGFGRLIFGRPISKDCE